jgi:hypothetical protein
VGDDREPDGGDAEVSEAHDRDPHALPFERRGLVVRAAEDGVDLLVQHRRDLGRRVHGDDPHLARVDRIGADEGGPQGVERVARRVPHALPLQILGLSDPGVRRRDHRERVDLVHRGDDLDRNPLGDADHGRARVGEPEQVTLVPDQAHGRRRPRALADLEVDAFLPVEPAVEAEVERRVQADRDVVQAKRDGGQLSLGAAPLDEQPKHEHPTDQTHQRAAPHAHP